MSFINQVGNALTGSTGTGNFVGANTPTLITPVIGSATGTSLTVSGNLVATAGTIYSGASAGGFSGQSVFYSPTSAKGNLNIYATDSSGNYAAALTNASLTASRTWTLPDATGTLALTSQLLSGAVLLAPSGSQVIIGNYDLKAYSITTTSSFYGGSASGGSPGQFTFYSATVSKGNINLYTTDSSVNASIGITNASFGQSSTLTIPDPGASTASFILSAMGSTQTIGSALSVTGNLTPSQTNGIVGTTTNNNANAGSVGEFVFSQIAQSSAISLSTGTSANVTSISLTAGDWDVFGTVVVIVGNGTSFTSAIGAINITSASLPDLSTWGAYYSTAPLVAYTQAAALSLVPPTQRFSLSGTTTIYLIAQANFAVSTVTACGIISARRVR